MDRCLIDMKSSKNVLPGDLPASKFVSCIFDLGVSLLFKPVTLLLQELKRLVCRYELLEVRESLTHDFEWTTNFSNTVILPQENKLPGIAHCSGLVMCPRRSLYQSFELTVCGRSVYIHRHTRKHL